jgi:diguanylate cyclase
MQNQIAVDDLTGALRRAAGEARLEQEIRRARRSPGSTLVIAFLDVDSLKAVNDSAGHSAGDRLLQFLVGTLRARLRSYDVIIRWGGDEFVCVLPQTPLDAAEKVFGEVVESFGSQTGRRFTAGFAELKDEDTLSELVARADHDLYVRKTKPPEEPAPPPPTPVPHPRRGVTRRLLHFLTGS